MTTPAPGSPDEPGARPLARASGGARDGDEIPIDVDLIKVLASDTRRDVLRLLGERRRTLTELAEAVGLKKATILEHLEKLQAAGLIRRLDDGERIWIYYELTPRGSRIVHPGRTTRFYLIMAGSAAAVVLVGAIVAAAMMGGVGFSPAREDSAGSPQATLAEDLRVDAPVVVWRGFDDGVPITLGGAAPDGSTLLLGPLELPVLDQRVVLNAEQIDALPDGRHAMRLRTAAGDLALPTPLEARAPPVALSPLAVPEDRASALLVSVGEPGRPAPTNVAVRVDGQPVALGEVGRDRTFSVAPTEPGALRVEVGRLVVLDVRVLPHLDVAAARENGTLLLNVADANGPVPGVEASLGATALGTTAQNGTLAAAWPLLGEHALRLRAPDGRALERAVAVTDDALLEIGPRLALTAYTNPGISTLSAQVEVRNAGVANETVTLVARLDGAAIASALVEVPANGRAQAPLRADVALTRPIVIEAYGAEPQAIALRGFANLSTADAAKSTPPPTPATAPVPTQPPAAPPAAPAGGTNEPSGRYSYDMYYAGRAPDATTTLYPSTPTAASERSMTGTPAPQVPFVSPVVLVAALAAVALLMRRGAAGRR